MSKTMDQIVQELRKVIQFKSTTEVGDVVLVAAEKSQTVFYAVVMEISRDENVRDEWWHLALTVLGVPPQRVVWTLREPQFTGKETFSMAGEGRFIQAIELPGTMPDEGVAAPQANKALPTKTAAKKARGGLRRVK